ncbi:hypothetical protein RUM43_010158 [Polyplax serrata]|uniref:Uncharacterized protein n=1 Tax=Polyplax serrata TaxID=468196 RepID=A0AAN8PKG8_POLSC
MFFHLFQQKKTDINSNMRPAVTLNHPFLNGCKNLPTDRSEELEQMKIWMQTQPHLPPLKGRYHAGAYSVIRFRYVRSKPPPSLSNSAAVAILTRNRKAFRWPDTHKGRRMSVEESG